MRFVMIVGPPAVGKMTVGYELAQLTGLRLFHNHMTVDPVLELFEFGTPPFQRLVGEFRRRIFEEVAASTLPGLIFTYVWAFDDPRDATFVEECFELFRRRGAATYLVELEARMEQRISRNATEFRLARKPSKRDLAASRARLLDMEQRYKMNSTGELAGRENYLRIDNTEVPAAEVARRIADAFQLVGA